MSTITLTSAGQVIDALGGTVALARMLSVSAAAVSNYRARNAFPSNSYLALGNALAAQGASAPASLWGMRALGAPARTASPSDTGRASSDGGDAAGNPSNNDTAVSQHFP